jgi:hypothetical protein
MSAPTGHGRHGWWEPVWELVVRVTVGSLLFAIIFAPAVGLDLAVGWLKANTAVSDFIVWLLTATKIAVGVIDAVLYVLFMLRMGWVFVRKLFWGAGADGHSEESV